MKVHNYVPSKGTIIIMLRLCEREVTGSHSTRGKQQDSAHTGRECSAPTTTQPLLPPLRLVIPPPTECKKF